MIRSDYEHVGAKRREAVLEALLSATKELYGSDVRSAVERALEIAARAVDADAIRLFRFTAGESGQWRARDWIGWTTQAGRTAAGSSSDGARPLGTATSGYHLLKSGTPIYKRTKQLSGPERRVFVERGVVATILYPVFVDGALWGGLQFEQHAPLGAPWAKQEAALFEPFARHLAAMLEARRTEVQNVFPEASRQQDGQSRTRRGEASQADQLKRRVRAERALVEASKLLLSTEQFDMERLLRIVGEATGADYAYLISIRPEEGDGPPPLAAEDDGSQSPIDLDAYAHYEWHAQGARRRSHAPFALADEASESDGATFAVPIISAENLLFGYLGIEFEDEISPLKDEDVRVLNVLGDMLCTYLQRQITDRALRKSERRYRYFIGTISEAIWRIDFDPPVPTDQSPDDQIAAIMQHGSMAECNEELARLFGVERPAQLIGWDVERLTEFTGRRIVRDLIDASFRLQGREYIIYDENRDARHFLVNTSGVVEGGQLVAVWGSTTEVTERVQLERRMVTALEQQQQRIGRDLHDSVGQLLTGVRMLAQNLKERHFSGERTPGNEQVRKIISYADEAAKHVSDLQRGLMPVQMERGGLAQALRELASNTDVLPDVDCIYVHDGTTDVRAQEKKLQLYRIAQEATNNALKHAKPSYIKIVLKTVDNTVVLEVEDDGTGFDMEQEDKESLGLHSMFYRARAINADLRVHSEPDCGTTVRCEILRRDLIS